MVALAIIHTFFQENLGKKIIAPSTRSAQTHTHTHITYTPFVTHIYKTQ